MSTVKNAAKVSYEIDIDKIEMDYREYVKLGGREADWEKRRKAAREDDSMSWMDEPRRFDMTLTKDEARGFAIGSRIRVTAERVEL